MRKFSILTAAAMLALAVGAADARTVKWARGADALTLDPHGQNEGPTIAFNNQVYESLISRDNANKLIPALAVSWKLVEPTTWEFKLRPGVKFHGGEDFTADDVVFSFQRALAPTSDYKGYLANTKEIVKVDDLTVQIKTDGPNPLVADNLTSVFIMSKKWAEAHNATKPQDFKNKDDNYAERNEAYWGRKEVPLEITELVLTTIKQDATRVAALLSGEVDVVQDVPVQDIERLKNSPTLRVTEGPENRSIFFGFDVASKELASSDVKGKNPFADVRVRQAVNIAINWQAIQRVVMRGQSVPAGSIVGPFVTGYKKEYDNVGPPDGAKAKGLLAAAGYPNGFSVSLHCPNDRYLNDEAICQGSVGKLGPIGIKINLVSQSKSLHFPTLQNLKSDFYLLGWGVPTYDSDYIFSYLYHTRAGTYGGWNMTRYSNPDVDKLIESISNETDTAKRNATIATIWDKLIAEQVYVAIHHQMLAHAMKGDIDVPVRPDNIVFFKYVAFKKS